MSNAIDPSTVQQIAEVNTAIHEACSVITTQVRLWPPLQLLTSSASCSASSRCPASI